MIYYLNIIRPLNCLITFVTVIVAAFIASENSFQFDLVLSGAFAAALTAAGGNVINDYFDIEIDRIAHPTRPLVTGKILKTQALRFYLLLNAAAIIISFFINVIILGIVFLSIVLLFLYSFSLKRLILFSNFIIAWLTGIAFLFGGIIVGNAKAAVIPAIFAFLINFIREIVKDIQDMDGDLNAGVITFPAKFGVAKTKNIIIILTLTLILLTLYPFIFNYYRIEYFVAVMMIVNPLLVYFLKSIVKDFSKNNLQKMSGILKLNMVFGLIAIYLGK
jgi:geranylgeranylglycerol-phosphate geranylgeranyltransferase